MHLAAKCGDAEMLRVLLAALCEADVSALVDLGDHNDITPVFLAVQRWVERGGATYSSARVGSGGSYYAAGAQHYFN